MKKTTTQVITLPAALAEHAPHTWVSYSRKSNSKGLDQRFNSIDAQQKRAEEHAAPRPNWTFAGHYADGGKSGATLNRKDFRRLLADAQAGKFDTVVVYKIDRLSRSLLGFAEIERLFKPLGIQFVFATEQFADNPSGRLTRNLRMSISEYERELGIERTTDKIASTRKEGLWAGGPIPLGYDSKEKRLQINTWEAKIVRDMFALYLQHRSAATVARILRSKGYKTKERKYKGAMRSAQTWTKAAVLAVLKNPIYAGLIPHGEELYPGEHEPIVTREQYEQARALLRHNAIDGESHAVNPDYVLRGVLRCASTTNDGTPCGHGFVPGSTRKGAREFRYYRCAGREKLGSDVCPCKSLPADAIETYVTDQIRAATADTDFMGKLRASVASLHDYGGRVSAYRMTLAARETELGTEGVRLADALQRAEGASLSIYERQINGIGERLGDARKRLERLDRCAERLQHAEREGSWMVEQLSRFGEAWALLSGENRARLVDAIVDEIHVNETANAVEIVFAPFGRDLPALAEFDDTDTRELGAMPEPLRVTVRETLFRARGRAVSFDDKAPVVRLPVRRAAKVAHMLALAHHIDRAINEGRFKDRATVARYLEMTRARITYLMQLTLLAPDIQETILHLYSVDGSEPLSERALRPVVRAGAWARQREIWARTIAPLLGSKGGQ